MKITTKGKYGLGALVEIAARNEKSASIKSIAHKQGISAAYLEQIFALLKRADILRSERGVKGGFALSRPAKDITAAEIINVLEGGLSPIECLEDGNCGKETEICEVCNTSEVWKRLYLGIKDALTNITLEELALKNKEAVL